MSVIINYLLLFSAGLIWGSQYILNKIALESFSTSMIAVGRVGIGALVLTLLLIAGAEKPSGDQPAPSFWKALPDFILIGLLEATLPCILVAWAQLRLPSSMVAILIGTVPLFTTLLEALFIKGNSRLLSLKKMAGILLGFAGIVVLVGPEFFTSNIKTTSNSVSLFLPIVAVLASALSFAVSMLLIQVRLGPYLSHLGPIRSTQGILTGAIITTIPLMVWFSKPWKITSFHPTPSAVIALVALGIFCGGLAYTLFVILIKRAGPSFASTCNYLVPLTGAFLGIFFCGENMTSTLLGSLGLILFSLWLSSGIWSRES
ncbi:MAG: DMT family transporter [Chthoniobacterales bacterium]